LSIAESSLRDRIQTELLIIIVSRQWNLENSNIKRAWKQHVQRLNTLKIPGLINKMPWPIEENNKEVICKTL